MKKTPVNPWAWSLRLGYNQAEIIEGAKRQLICSGQTAVDGDGNPQHSGDMRNQMELSLKNLEAVLDAGNMGFVNLTRLTIYTTDVDESLKHFDLLGAKLGAAGVAPPMSLVGVTRLALPTLMFEIEATACD
jgi:enamine deaminase RidA (YjgF/YER057c/UK114 family)